MASSKCQIRRGNIMTDYKAMCFLLFNKITDTIDDLQKIQKQVEMCIVQEESNTSINDL